MKAGILTFHEANNYGAVLQAYALQQTLKKLDVESELISILPKRHEPETSQPMKSSPLLKRIQEAGKKRAQKFDDFRKEYLVCSVPYSNDNLRELNNSYDFFIAGSDQIWNVQIPDADPVYFLPFADPKKCYSYAASFGSAEIIPSAKDWCGKQLSRFSLLSVREEAGRTLIRNLINREATVCLDPTLLLDSFEWSHLTAPVSDSPYYLLYMLKYDDLLVQKAREEAEKTKIDLKVITSSFIPQFGISTWSEIEVIDWLSLFAGAKGIFTNSFHGTAFSIIFEKPLCVELLGDELESRNSRIEDLLKKAGLTAIEKESQTFLYVESAKKNLSQLKTESMQYLHNIITHALQQS